MMDGGDVWQFTRYHVIEDDDGVTGAEDYCIKCSRFDWGV